MKLNNLLKDVNITKKINYKNFEVLNLEHNSNLIKKGGLFFCVNGSNFNGENFAKCAVENGASVVVTEHEIKNLRATQIVVENVRIAMAQISKKFYGNACDKLKIIMVTGTNGKTTITYMLQSMFNAAGIKCAIIGTNGIFCDNVRLYYGLTTPDPIDLHYYFKQLVNLNVKVVVMEASAHAIYLNKLCGISGEAIIFTNLTNEHLDFFGSMQNYAKVKLDYINSNKFKRAIVNADCGFVSSIMENKKVLYYGLKNPSHTFAVNIKHSINGSEYFVNCMDEIMEVNSHQVGQYNVYNTLACITLCKALKLKTLDIMQGIKNLTSIPGRFNVVNLADGKKVIIDFAHTPDGFFSVLSEIKKFCKGNIITLFGCVGYSDSLKRSEMGKIAADFSSELIITADNPNFEDFNKINLDITRYVKTKFTEIFDRFSAIEYGMEKLDKNDFLVLLGKGAETHNFICGKKIKHNDFDAVEEIVNKLNLSKKENA